MGKDHKRDEARQRLQAAGYTTGRSQHEARCSSCTHCALSGGMFKTAHDRHCKLLDAGVKTHGACRMHKAAVRAS